MSDMVVPIQEQTIQFESPVLTQPNKVQTYSVENIEMESMLEYIIKTISLQNANLHNEYDTREDFDWFTSGQLETDSFKGQHIAIWKKQIVGSGETPLEAERIAKAYCGNDCRPAVVYIPKDEEVDAIF